MFTAQFTRRFSAAHRLPDDPGVCHRIHGHNYEAEIIVESNVLGKNNMVIPADKVKELVDARFDHRLILAENDNLSVGRMVPLTGFQEDEGRTRFESTENIAGEFIVRVPGTPSTEFLASVIADTVCQATWEFLGEGVVNEALHGVRVTVLLRETPTIQAVAESEIQMGPA